MHSEDIIVWPDSTLCYREDLSGMNHKSDDYRVIPQPLSLPFSAHADDTWGKATALYMYFWAYLEDCVTSNSPAMDPDYQGA